MKKIYSLAICLVLFLKICSAQSIEKTYPDTLWAENDTVKYLFSNFASKPFIWLASSQSKESPGTDGDPQLSVTFTSGKNSITIKHENFPYQQVWYIPFKSPKGSSTLRMHFNPKSSYFDAAYIKNNKGKINFELPEVYELANIIWALCPSGKRAQDLETNTAYYKKVIEWFKPHLDHPLFKKLDFADSLYFDKYYAFRENSFCFKFKGNKIVNGGTYFETWEDGDDFNNLFSQLIPLAEDFALKSKFRDFYKNNQPFYNRLIAAEKELLPVKMMWDWLEDEFPGRKYDSYKIVFSPLIRGSHSTQNFSNDGFRENVMFICGPERYEADTSKTTKQREGLMSGIVFTEIDHNYVNPTTNKYYKTVDSIFSKRAVWVSGKNTGYKYSTAVFNEYMTHAVFCQYINDRYDPATAKVVINERVDMNVNRRGFYKFKEFNDELSRLHAAHKELKMGALYPLILAWCKTQG